VIAEPERKKRGNAKKTHVASRKFAERNRLFQGVSVPIRVNKEERSLRLKNRGNFEAYPHEAVAPRFPGRCSVEGEKAETRGGKREAVRLASKRCDSRAGQTGKSRSNDNEEAVGKGRREGA